MAIDYTPAPRPQLSEVRRADSLKTEDTNCGATTVAETNLSFQTLSGTKWHADSITIINDTNSSAGSNIKPAAGPRIIEAKAELIYLALCKEFAAQSTATNAPAAKGKKPRVPQTLGHILADEGIMESEVRMNGVVNRQIADAFNQNLKQFQTMSPHLKYPFQNLEQGLARMDEVLKPYAPTRRRIFFGRGK